jgi:hypothetical protein
MERRIVNVGLGRGGARCQVAGFFRSIRAAY